MWLSYQNINKIMKTFESTIPHCDNLISIVILGYDTFFIIIIKDLQGYHQVQVCTIDK